LPDGAVQSAREDATRLRIPEGGTATDGVIRLSTGKVAGIIFDHKNAEGIQDPDESDINGVGIVVTNCSGSSQSLPPTVIENMFWKFQLGLLRL
jgi:hypothetical protein